MDNDDSIFDYSSLSNEYGPSNNLFYDNGEYEIKNEVDKAFDRIF